MNKDQLEVAKIRLDCAKIAIDAGTRLSITKDACVDVAEKIYQFVIGKGPDKAPEDKQAQADNLV